MGSTRIRAGCVLLAGALLAGACSDGSSDVQPLPPEPDESTSSSSSTTTGLPAVASTTSTTALEPSSSTLPNGKPILEIPTEWDSELDEIFGRYLLYWDALAIAFGPPEADFDYPPLEELAEPEALDDLEQQLRESRDSGQVLVETDTATDHIPRLPNPSVLSKTEGNEVVIQDCFIDGRVLKTVGGEVIDDQVVAKLMNVKMEVLGGEWRVGAVREASPESDGYEECRDYGEQLE